MTTDQDHTPRETDMTTVRTTPATARTDVPGRGLDAGRPGRPVPRRHRRRAVAGRRARRQAP